MSSRLIPPKPGAISFAVRTISSGSWVSRQMGKASTPANSLKSAALPSITGIAAFGPMFPRPNTADPSVMTATVFFLMVSWWALLGSFWIAMHTRATPGVYTMERSSRVLMGLLACTVIFPPRWARKVRSETFTTFTPGTLPTASAIFVSCASSRAFTVMSRMIVSLPKPAMSTASMSPPSLPIADVTLPNIPGRFRISTRIVIL